MRKWFIISIIVSYSIMLVVDWMMTSKITYHQPETIMVTVTGQLDNPGTFTLPFQATFEELQSQLQLQSDADISMYHPKMRLKDQDQIQINSKNQQKISINTADITTLNQIKGIGPVTAKRIIEYRQQHGLFQRLEDLMNIKGIKQATFQKMLPYIKL